MNMNVWNKIKGHPSLAQGTAYAILFTMGTCHLLNDMIQSVIPALYPLLKDLYGFTFAQIGLITLVFQLTSSISSPSSGCMPTVIRSPIPCRWGCVLRW